MTNKKAQKTIICFYCSTEFDIINNDKQFSWDLHRQDIQHVKGRSKKHMKLTSNDIIAYHMEKIKQLYQSNDSLQQLSDELVRLADNELSKKHRNQIVANSIARIFSEVLLLDNFQVIAFGSRMTGLTTKETGDLDFFVDTSEEQPIKTYIGNAELENWALRKAADHMKSDENEEWANINPVLDCRTPILKAFHIDTRMQVDISVMNGFGVVNTELISLYLNKTPLLRQIILLVRDWAIFCEYNMHFNNYAISLLVLFYFQQKHYAPSVYDFEFDYTGTRKKISGYDCLNYNEINYDWNKLIDSSRIGIKLLLTGFFQFYATFDFRNDVICPLLGKPVKKRLFNNNHGAKLPPEMSTYIDKARRGEEKYKVNNYGMNVQDPIDLAHNVTKSTSEIFLNNFILTCDATRRTLELLK